MVWRWGVRMGQILAPRKGTEVGPTRSRWRSGSGKLDVDMQSTRMGGDLGHGHGVKIQPTRMGWRSGPQEWCED